MLLAWLLVALQLTAAPTLVEVRIHGNHTTPDAAILAIAGLAVDRPFDEALLADARQRLIDSGRFERVEVLKRFRSIDDPNQILAVILVDERPGATPEGGRRGPLGWLAGQSMWAPILGFEDGYGFTYGARLSLVDALGPRSRVSVPLTWGGERRAGVELDRAVAGPIVSRVFGGVSVTRRENPFFAVGDARRTLSAGAERRMASWLTAAAQARVVHVGFGAIDQSFRGAGLRVTADTRRDPAFPRNAVLAQGGWEHLAFDGGRSAERWSGDVRAYVGLIGPAVLAIGGGIDRASAPLPAYEQQLLGGAATLRGYRAGTAAGDSRAVASAEIRVPLSSPLSIGRFGVKAFTDLGVVWNSGERLVDRPWSRGIGGGAFLTLTVLSAGVDVAWSEAGRARAHVSLGVTF